MKRSAPLKRTAIKPSKTPMQRTSLLSVASVQMSLRAKEKKCANKACRKPFSPDRMGQRVCGWQCGLIVGRETKAKTERKTDRARLNELRPRKWWLEKAKAAMHAYIRARDEGKSCISCETILVRIGRVGGDYDAGHFRSVGSAKHLQFVENNIHGQCKRCNDYLKGNQTAYEHGLAKRFSREYVEELKCDQAPRHLTIEDFQVIESTYKAKLKELQALDKGVV